jgi:hypothetical protein
VGGVAGQLCSRKIFFSKVRKKFEAGAVAAGVVVRVTGQKIISEAARACTRLKSGVPFRCVADSRPVQKKIHVPVINVKHDHILVGLIIN